LCFLGIIDEDDKSQFVLNILPNRKSSTFKNIIFNFLRRECYLNSLFSSYLSVVDEFKGIHVVVENSKGFKNDEGQHTNNIKNLWCCLKSDMGRRHGLCVKTLVCLSRNGFGKEKCN
jgi:hypothetical protein